MKILFGADMAFTKLSGYPGDDVAKKAMEDPAKLFENADFSMVNLENIFGNQDDYTPIVKAGPNLISDERFIEYINALKPTVVGMANNHSKDFGEEPMLNTVESLRNKGYEVIGVGKNIEEAYRQAKLSKDGVDVAIVAVCENEFGGATESESGTAGYSLRRVANAIFKAKKEGCKSIVYFHGGNECYTFPSPGKVDLYRHFIDIGADAVIAMHTHCPQGYETYNGKPIVYSMGNFYFPLGDVKKEITWSLGYLTELNISADKISLEIHPYKFDNDKLTILQGEEKAYFEKYMEVLNAPLSDSKKIKEYFDSWCHISTSYLRGLGNYRDGLFADGNAVDVKSLKNIFCCEAHNELVTNSLKLVYDEKVEESKKYVEYIKKLKNYELA